MHLYLCKLLLKKILQILKEFSDENQVHNYIMRYTLEESILRIDKKAFDIFDKICYRICLEFILEELEQENFSVKNLFNYIEVFSSNILIATRISFQQYTP